VEGVEGHSDQDWYVVVANHRSWTDILVLQKVFNRRIPFLKFLLKKELIWVPFLGIAWWCLDYPFLARTGRAEKDLKAIRDAAEKFKALPVSFMNFVEGTRLTPEKRERQGSPYRNLLKPRPGGLAVILHEMGSQLRAILDVTIVYPEYPAGGPTLWTFLCGGVPRIRVRCRAIPIDESLLGDYAGDKAFRRVFGSRLEALWAEKDEEISAARTGPQNLGTGYRSR
jgi:1-acyl-sn-glycerol-3-phosphate acyltransferase